MNSNNANRDGFPIQPNKTGFCKVYHLTPLLANNRDKRGLALDGKLKHEDSNLASSAILGPNAQKENLGIIVTYKVKIRLILGFGTSDLFMELPFTLTHPKPPTDDEPPAITIATDTQTNHFSVTGTQTTREIERDIPVVDASLISIDTSSGEGYYANQEEYFIFEDFARLRLQGTENDDTDALRQTI